MSASTAGARLTAVIVIIRGEMSGAVRTCSGRVALLLALKEKP